MTYSKKIIHIITLLVVSIAFACCNRCNHSNSDDSSNSQGSSTGETTPPPVTLDDMIAKVQVLQDKGDPCALGLLTALQGLKAGNTTDIEVVWPTMRGSTPLYWAVHYKEFSMVEALVKAGANVNSKNPSDETPLWLAAESCEEQIVDFLLANKADKTIASKAGTPYQIALAEAKRASHSPEKKATYQRIADKLKP